ncbi:undecaprenyl-diphosphatase [Klebsiella michiganensis]
MNVLETLNQSAFLALNASPGTPEAILALARFSASGIIFVIPAILLWLWFSGGRQGHRQALFCTLSIVIALGLGSICGMLLFHPRPFMIPLGHTWINHPADNSFPSDHGTVMFSAAFALLSLRSRAAGLFLLLAALPVAWSRIFLGVHFPLDMVGAALVSACGVCVAKLIWSGIGHRLTSLCEAISRRLFAWLPPRFTP